MADVVITKFEADFTGFDAAIDSQSTEIDRLQKSLTAAPGSGKDLSGARGDAGRDGGDGGHKAGDQTGTAQPQTAPTGALGAVIGAVGRRGIRVGILEHAGRLATIPPT